MRLYVSCLAALLLLVAPVLASAQETPAGKSLILLHTKDLHGRFLEHTEQDKSIAAVMSAYFKQTKAANENVLVLDTGNYSPNYQYAKIIDRQGVVTLMGKMGYDALNIGSHEIDEGIKSFSDMVHASQVPLLNVNVEFTAPELDTKIKPYIIKELNGLKVGIIGFVGNDYATQYIKDKNLKITDPDAQGRLTKLVEKLKTETDAIIILANASMDDILKATERLSGQNIVVLVGWGVADTGYNFKVNRLPGRTGSPLFLFTLSDTVNQLKLNIHNKEIKGHSLNSINIMQLSHEDEGIAKETAAIIEKRNQYYQQNIGVILNDIDARRKVISNMPTNAVSLLAQSVREKWKDVDCVVINSGAIYSYQDDIIRAGPMSIDAFSKLYPFMNTVVIAKLSGRDIKSMLERSSSSATFTDQAKAFGVHQMRSFLQSSGLAYTLDFSQTSQLLSEDDKQVIREGRRVRSISINKKPLDPDTYYTVATNDYVFGGGDGYVQFKYAKDVIRTDIQIQDLMQDYLKRHSPIGLDPPDYILFLNRTEKDYQQVGTPRN